jgi:hypothetical protein
MEPLTKPDLAAVLAVIQSHHVVGADCRVIAKNAELLTDDIRRELPLCAVEVQEFADGRKTLLVHRPVVR